MKKTIFMIALILIVIQLFSAEKFAVLITGQAADHGDPNGAWAIANPGRTRHTEFWYDTAMMWHMLRNHGYSAENIFVLYGEGVDYNPDFEMPAIYSAPFGVTSITDFRADRANLEAVMDGLAHGNQNLGIPNLNNDDFLFIWTFDHGNHASDNSPVVSLCLMDNIEIWDWEFALLLGQIDCQKKVVWMQQCFSGGFIDDLEALNQPIVVNTACHYSTSAQGADNLPVQENEIIDGVTYFHGEFNYHSFSITNGASPIGSITYNGIPYSTYDFDEDGIVSIYESSEWISLQNSVPAVPQYSDLGNIGFTTSLKYPNLIFGNVSESREIAGIIAVTGELNVINNSNLTIGSGARLILKDRHCINIEPGSTLIISDNVEIIGETTTIPHDEFNPEDIPGNRINVYGNISLGNGVHFTSENNNYWDGVYIYHEDNVNITQVDFTNCSLYRENGTINITNSNFVNSSISCINSNLSVTDCPTLGGIYCIGNEMVDIRNNTENTYTITGDYDGVCLINCGETNIYGYTISGNARHGVNLHESYGDNTVQNCTIISNNSDGVRLYHSNARIIGCTICGNNKGIIAYRGSNADIFKEEGSPHFSSINNNTWQEILFTDDCAVNLLNGFNSIEDQQFIDGTFDQFLVQCPNMSFSRDFGMNFWGLDDGGNPEYPPEERFFPSCINPDGDEIGFILEPLWIPDSPQQVTWENDEYVYHNAIALALADNTEGAISLFKQIIDQYPNSEYAPMSAKNLLALEQDKQALKDYYHTEPNLHWNGEIDKLAEYLENYCNIQMGDYQEAIAWFEAIISDPPSELDSLMAVIDLGYVYLLMQEYAPRAEVICMYPQLKPRSRAEYERNTDAMLSALYTPTDNPDVNDSGSNSILSSIPLLRSNYPNPFNPSTTISFTLPKEMQTNLVIYNLKGQKVKTLLNRKQTLGQHSIIWNGKDENGRQVSSGIYFYKLITPDKVLTSKMVMMK